MPRHPDSTSEVGVAIDTESHVKFVLAEDQVPTHWVNLLPELPGDPLPPLHPGTLEPAGPHDLSAIFRRV